MSDAEVTWHWIAEEALSQAPKFVRGTIKKKVEAAAREAGISEITIDFMAEVKEKADKAKSA